MGSPQYGLASLIIFPNCGKFAFLGAESLVPATLNSERMFLLDCIYLFLMGNRGTRHQLSWSGFEVNFSGISANAFGASNEHKRPFIIQTTVDKLSTAQVAGLGKRLHASSYGVGSCPQNICPFVAVMATKGEVQLNNRQLLYIENTCGVAGRLFRVCV